MKKLLALPALGGKASVVHVVCAAPKVRLTPEAR